MARIDMFGHDKRDQEQIRKDNEKYFNRKKNRKSGFHGLSEGEKEVLKKGAKVVKKGAKKVAGTAAAGARKAYNVAKPVVKKVSRKAKAAKNYGKHVGAHVIAASERGVKKAHKKTVSTAKSAWASLKAYEKKTRVRKKKPKFNMETKKWE